jgi:hypothetical protein
MTIAEALPQPLASAERWREKLAARFSLSEDRVVEVSTAITCVLILLAGPKEWYVSVFTSALAAAALILRGLRAQPVLWAFFGTAVGASALYNWEYTDNHKYLLAYFCFAVMLSLGATDQRSFLAKSARSLIGVSFAMAVLWKVRSPDFIEGDFFRIHLLTDKRFVAVASWLGGVEFDSVRDFGKAWGSLETITDLSKFRGFDVTLPARLNAVAVGMTVWTLFIEVWIALAFLVPERTLLARYRDLALLLFAMTTYPVATVIGFGYLLLAMGLCQTRSALARPVYIVAFFVMFLFEIPVFALSTDNPNPVANLIGIGSGDQP